MAFQGLFRNVIKPCKEWVSKSKRVGADLVVPLKVAEEKKFVFLNRPAESPSELFPNKERILDTRARGGCRVDAKKAELRWIGGTFEARERRHVVIAEEEEGAAVKLVRAGSSDDIHGSGRDGPGGKVEGQRADLELLHRL